MFNVKVFYVMGKALSGELSCPCDRSCYLELWDEPWQLVQVLLMASHPMMCYIDVLSFMNNVSMLDLY